MAEIMDIQARHDLSDEMVRAKDSEAKLGFEIENLKEELAKLKEIVEGIDLSTDETPTYESDKLITSGAVYAALSSLNRKVDALK